MTTTLGELRKPLLIGGLAVTLMVAAPVLAVTARLPQPWKLAPWSLALLIFAASFSFAVRGGHRILLVVQSACVMALVLLLCDGFEGALLVLVALQLGSRASRKVGLIYIGAQSALLTAAVAVHWNLKAALLLLPPWLGFQVLAFFVAEVMARLSAAQAELRVAHAAQLESAGLQERLRISRELHDLLGHHLAALNLNLEVAARRAEGAAREPVVASQGLARTLLAKVRGAVDVLREPERLDLCSALRALAEELPHPRIHVTAPESLRLRDPLTLLRCAQEMATNAARHAGAENLWIDLEQRGSVLELRARDDGKGAPEVRPGNGLRGMRERLERKGGALTIETRPGQGFSLCATVPAERA